MSFRLLCTCTILVLIVGSCSTVKELTGESQVSAKVIQYGLFNGVKEGTKNEEGLDIYCESSAVTKMGEQLVIANDKFNPDGSVFSIPLSKKMPATIETVTYANSNLLNEARKIESMAYSPTTGLHFFATAFDRIKPDGSWDGYNTIGYWEGDNIAGARILYRTENEGVVSSKNLREALHREVRDRKYVSGVSYFKIEGLAVLPNNSLLFGIREMGPSYQDFDYKIMILATSFLKTRDGVVINPDLKKVYEFDPQKSNPNLQHPLGLSSMEYHKESNSLIILTTYEKEGKGHVTYLWMLPIQKRLSMRTKPILVTDDAGKPLELPYKGEGLTILDKNSVFIVFDEDRVLNKVPTTDGTLERKSYQGIYGIVDLKF